MAKKIENEDLARMIQRGFVEVHDEMDSFRQAVDKRFEVVDKRFQAVDKRFEGIGRDIAAIRFTLTELAYRDEVRALESRLERIEKHLGLSMAKK